MNTDNIEPPRIARLPDDFRWPGGRRVAVIFNIAFEAWSDGQAPGIGPMGNVLKPGYFDTNAHSWAAFGIHRGIHRLIGIADKHGVKASVMVNGVICERDPDTVRRIAGLGHEIVNHSWGMDVIPVYLDEAAERQNLERNHELLTRTSGVAPTGWISPRGTGSLITSRLLAEAGYLHHGDVNDDDRPYVMEFGDRRIVGIPLTMDVNDLPTCIRYGQGPRHMLEIFEDCFRAFRERESVPLMLDVTAHTHVMGRPSGAWVYDEIMRRVGQAGDVWVCTRQEMARYVLDTI
ncbi:MAG: polysaccharide deacetylase family protein [Pigmentiphaga sp.]|uniref:polysaccharide deacetylase family protein n=1 Tax=Pigmentiphaga sp. TaxID=1977564 RepID=UPI0029A585E9|nr:polysaccharide deacetylase family protein [Pigmentiphaga sp.]MDX3907726.1 polysaccharide deacetylase family protein [Pigmentiphaga sp.]